LKSGGQISVFAGSSFAAGFSDNSANYEFAFGDSAAAFFCNQAKVSRRNGLGVGMADEVTAAPLVEGMRGAGRPGDVVFSVGAIRRKWAFRSRNTHVYMELYLEVMHISPVPSSDFPQKFTPSAISPFLFHRKTVHLLPSSATGPRCLI
jgi:hypothetical protein